VILNSSLEQNHSAAPILVTGAERSGTTWVGRMLSAGGQAVYMNEPLNITAPCIWMNPPVAHWCPYICKENEAAFLPSFQRALRFSYPLMKDLCASREPYEVRLALKSWVNFFLGRIFHKRALFKDPTAIFSALWLAERFNAQVVVVVRHPLSFVGSRKRLKWVLRLNDWLAQPLLVRDLLDPFVDNIQCTLQDVKTGKADLVDECIVYWHTVYQLVARYQQNHPSSILVRHEDISLKPIQAYGKLFSQLGLGFNERAQKIILQTSNTENPTETSPHHPHNIRLNSRANLDNWKHRLSEEEVRRVRRKLEETAWLYYPDSTWDTP